MSTDADFGLFSDVFDSLANTGLIVGRTRQLPDQAKEVMLVRHDPNAASALPIGAAVSFLTPGSYIVQAAATGDYILGVNDNVGDTIPKGAYFYITTKGPVNVLVDATTAAGAVCSLSLAAGYLAEAALTGAGEDVIQANIRTLAASGAGGVTSAYIY